MNNEELQLLKDEIKKIRDNQLKIGQPIIKNIYPLFRNYKLKLEGEENIPKDTNALFIVNHSNSHDIFTAYEFLSLLNRKGSVMVATDCLNPITTGIFNISNATLLDRRINKDRNNSILRMSSKIIEGNDGVIFGESTWNLHPTKVMHNIRQGISKISLISDVPIIPTIIEYIENDDLFDTESKLYKECVIRFGKPIIISKNRDLITQTNNLKEEMKTIRQQIWSTYDINRNNINDIDPNVYINHTYLKKFKAFGFTYDSKKEQEFLLFLGNEPKENEYTISADTKLIPGITEKNSILIKRIK